MSESMAKMMVRVGNGINKRMRDETERALEVVLKYQEEAVNVEGNPFLMEPKDFFILDNYIRVFSKTCGLIR